MAKQLIVILLLIMFLGDINLAQGQNCTLHMENIEEVTPECTGGCVEFMKKPNSSAPGGTMVNVSTLSDCQSACLSSYITCYGYHFAREWNSCTLYSEQIVMSNLTYDQDWSNDLYVRNFCDPVSDTSISGCRDRFLRMPNYSAPGGVYINSSSVSDCQSACISSNITCYGCHLKREEMTFFLHFEEIDSSNLLDSPGTDLDVRIFCAPGSGKTTPGCIEFMKKPNHRLQGGTRVNATSVSDCQSACISYTTTCYGYGFYSRWYICILYSEESDRSNVLQSHGTDLYMRNFCDQGLGTTIQVSNQTAAAVSNQTAPDAPNPDCSIQQFPTHGNGECAPSSKRLSEMRYGRCCVSDLYDYSCKGLCSEELLNHGFTSVTKCGCCKIDQTSCIKLKFDCGGGCSYYKHVPAVTTCKYM